MTNNRSFPEIALLLNHLSYLAIGQFKNSSFFGVSIELKFSVVL